MKRLFCFLSSLSVMVALLAPVSVFADSSPSYIIYDDCGPWLIANGSGNQYYFKIENNSSDVRIVAIGSASTSSAVFAFSESSFSVSGSSGSCPASAQNTANSYKGVYYRRLMPSSTSQQYGNYTFIKDIPLFASMTAENVNNNDTYAAWYYTFGAGAVAPETPSSYGDIVASYTSKIAGSGMNSVNNADVISWDILDSNGVNIADAGASVEVRVSSGDYVSTVSESDLLNKLYSDFNINSTGYYLASFDASAGSASFVWGDLIDYFSAGTLSDYYRPFLKNSMWMLRGWIYEARFVVDGYSSPWKVLYSVTSSGVQNQQTIINNSDYNYDVYNAFQNITDINDADSITYNIYNNDYTINNSNITNDSTNSDGSKKGSFWDFLSTIINAIKDLIKGLFDFISGLFDIDFNFNINSDIEDVKNNSGVFGQVVTIEQNIKTELENIETSEDFVLEYDSYSLNNVVIIPAGSIPVSDYFSALGLSHSDLYFYTDIIIYISLLVLVSKTLINFLRR